MQSAHPDAPSLSGMDMPEPDSDFHSDEDDGSNRGTKRRRPLSVSYVTPFSFLTLEASDVWRKQLFPLCSGFPPCLPHLAPRLLQITSRLSRLFPAKHLLTMMSPGVSYVNKER